MHDTILTSYNIFNSSMNFIRPQILMFSIMYNIKPQSELCFNEDLEIIDIIMSHLIISPWHTHTVCKSKKKVVSKN